MRKTLGIFILICVLSNFLFAQDFYDISTVNNIEITFTESNWDALLDDLASAGLEERLMATVSINGEQFDSVGVRYKGNSSYSADRDKNPFNIKLDYLIDDQDIDGYGSLKLSNNYNDPSFVREVLSYEIARKYMPAPLSNYATVYVNGSYMGLYTSNQDVDKYFMRTHFSSDDNIRVKGEINSSRGPGGPEEMGGVWEYFGTDTTDSDYSDDYTMESDFGWSKLVDFLDTLNNNNTEVSSHLNIDRHLWLLAFENLVVNLDGPINNPQNYYLIEDVSGRFNIIPWDFNESFGVYSNLQTSDMQMMNTSDLQDLDPFVNIDESEYPVISKILSIPEYKKMYVAHMKTIIDENFSNSWYTDRASEIQNIIDADVQADDNKFYTYSDFTDNVTSSVGSFGPPPSQSILGIAELMETRIDYLSDVDEFSVQAPEIENPDYSPELPSGGEEIFFTAEFQYATDAYLAYRYDDYSIFTKLPMFDDGNHNDGSSDDGLYGVSFIPESAMVNYYYYATNSDAASFLPVRAEYEFYTLNIPDDIVINEFMASNENCHSDQDGEFEDWIELYNNSDQPVSLSGYFLSDDAGELDQWAFPDTTMAAGSYLIVWADNDESQVGLHAGFKLSSSGESVFLSNSQLSIVDFVNYDLQSTDTTTGRFPNGVGDFTLMMPTYSAENQDVISSISELNNLNINIYPNPVSDILFINLDDESEKDITISVYSALGKCCMQLSSENNDKVELNVSSLPTGVYIISIESLDRSRSIKKFIKY